MQMPAAGLRFWEEKSGQRDYSDCWAISLHLLLYCLGDGSYGLISDHMPFGAVSLDLVRILSIPVQEGIILNKKHAHGLRNS